MILLTDKLKKDFKEDILKLSKKYGLELHELTFKENFNCIGESRHFININIGRGLFNE